MPSPSSQTSEFYLWQEGGPWPRLRSSALSQSMFTKVDGMISRDGKISRREKGKLEEPVPD